MRKRDVILFGLRAAIISQEFLILMICYLAFCFRQELEFLSVMGNNQHIVKWLAFVPSAMLVWTMKCWKGIRNPNHPRVQVYQSMKGFLMTKVVCAIGVFYALVAAVGGVLLFVVAGSICSVCMAIGLIAVVSVAGSCAITMYMAEMRVPELLNQCL